ncbi:MAG: hypothetical protein IJ856_00725 [Candidatus Methanomethylophilaceae archaeon]|nr:hypothetical protein [Candidatus Methanomethylophilaceae archaeon]
MGINLEEYKCEYCGRTCTTLAYAAFLCDSPECMEKARLARGGPGGHMKRKAEGRPIIPEDLEPALEDFNREFSEKKRF